MTKISQKAFGMTPDKKDIVLFTLWNGGGMKVEIINIGAAVVSLTVPDKDKRPTDVALGFSSGKEYVTNKPYFGAVVGRFANRIKNGEFKLDGKTYRLEKNDGNHHLHGGNGGYAKKPWDYSINADNTLTFALASPDGDEGYPGDLKIRVTYELKDDNSLTLRYEAETKSKTICNLTNHCYFNLNGCGSQTTVLNHIMRINADEITDADAELIPTGKFTGVSGTPFDFRSEKAIGKDISGDNPLIKAAGGYDHNYVLNPGAPFAARVYSPETGIVMEVETDRPGMQFYTGNFLDGSVTGKNGIRHEKQSGFCLETQFYPDTPNRPEFPSCVITPDKPLKTFTTYKFSVR